MSRFFLFFIIFISIYLYPSLSLYSQSNDSLIYSIFEKRGEIYFSFKLNDTKISIRKISENISIEKIINNVVYAYANRKEFEFIKNDINNINLIIYEKLDNNKLMAKNISEVKTWNYYPTYEQFDSIMSHFGNNYNNICEKKIIGQSVQLRNIYSVNITNKSINKAKSKVHIACSIHGNELIGYIVSLRLIDYLLNNYSTNEKIKNLIDNNEIWITPLLNPDGAYFGGNNTVASAKRYNYNNLDLNRNFPDAEDGEYPNGNRQVETSAIMSFVGNNKFTLSTNIHTGIELVNYPWDTWSKLHCDDLWFRKISRQYADTAQKYSPNGYFDDLYNGITNGYQWYTVSGSIQDYMNYFAGSKDITLEISNNHVVFNWQLEDFWNYNYRSLLNFINNINTGIRGFVSDSILNTPINAKVEFLEHDKDNSYVYSDKQTGYFHRLISNNTYDIMFSADGYISKTISNFEFYSDSTSLNIKLLKLKDFLDISNNKFDNLQIIINPVKDQLKFFFNNYNKENLDIQIFNIQGRIVEKYNLAHLIDNVYTLNINHFKAGIYIIKVNSSEINATKKFTVLK